MASLGYSPLLVIAANSSQMLLTHRREFIIQAKNQGFRVVAMCPSQGGAEAEAKLKSDLQPLGVDVRPFFLNRSSLNPFFELRSLWSIAKILKGLQPDVYQAFTVKPVVYGTIAALLRTRAKVVNTITGLGYSFTSAGLRPSVARFILTTIYRLLFKSPRVTVVFQNQDDLEFFVQKKWVQRNQAQLIPGTGIDTDKFAPSPEPAGIPKILFPARMLVDKGIRELIRASENLYAKGYQFRLVLCGDVDPNNRGSLSNEEVAEIKKKPFVDWLGYQSQMADVYKNSHLVCLPSYREGIPLSLIEAAACGRAIVTCDVPGCREVIESGNGGFLVPPQNVQALELALFSLLSSEFERRRMGRANRETCMNRFSKAVIFGQYLRVYGFDNKVKTAA